MIGLIIGAFGVFAVLLGGAEFIQTFERIPPALAAGRKRDASLHFSFLCLKYLHPKQINFAVRRSALPKMYINSTVTEPF